jgi:hypothetical protein
VVPVGCKGKTPARIILLREFISHVFYRTFSSVGVDILASGLDLRAEPSAKLWVGRTHLGTWEFCAK